MGPIKKSKLPIQQWVNIVSRSKCKYVCNPNDHDITLTLHPRHVVWLCRMSSTRIKVLNKPWKLNTRSRTWCCVPQSRWSIQWCGWLWYLKERDTWQGKRMNVWLWVVMVCWNGICEVDITLVYLAVQVSDYVKLVKINNSLGWQRVEAMMDHRQG